MIEYVDPYKTENTTNYNHPRDPNLNDIHNVLDYNTQGQPVLRTTSGGSATSNDSFGRMRVTEPFTLFESFHRYHDNGKIGVLTANGGTSTFNAGGWIDNTVTTQAGSKVVRETLRVFAYQPGKSLQMMISFNMAVTKTNLRQRAGLYDDANGVFMELLNDTLYFVLRSTSTGVTIENRISQADWNIDPLNGTGINPMVLNISKSIIFWADFEWLGVGTVRCGVVIDGTFIHCHSFHHSNYITGTYMQTACLPGRIEIENMGVTDSPSTYKQICFAVISEGGFELRGRAFSAGHLLNAPYSLTTHDVVYPLISIRLKANRLGAIALPKGFSIAPLTSGNLKYQILVGITSGGSWVSAGADSSVEYNLTATSISNSIRVFDQGYIISTNQSVAAPSLEGFPFKFQLERNPLSTPAVCYEFIVSITTTNNNVSVAGSITWDEVT